MPGKNRPRRKLIKKKQRQRRRQKQAQLRDQKENEDKAEKQKDPEYQIWQKQQEELEEFERLASERQQQDEEEAWLRREALAQRQFSLEAAQRRREEEKVNRLREQQAQELALIKEQQKRRRDENKKMAERAAAEFEAMMKTMDEYLNDSDKYKAPPLDLQRWVETHPQERLCEFFTRTNCCRFGHTCTHNHRRPMLARILLIRHFFSHPLLKQSSSDDYLELTEHDLRDSYDEFFHDAVAELEKFGKIINFRALRNTLDYLRGHVFVEYEEERHALKAFINLQGRYYASKQLNVEFSNLKGWRGAVCGLSLNRKCPKGYSCAYLHLFRNPNNLFNKDLEFTATPRSAHNISAITTPKISCSWNDHSVKDRNWRWSESPEIELKNSETQEEVPTSSRKIRDSQRSSSGSHPDHTERALAKTEKGRKSSIDHNSDSINDHKLSRINAQDSPKSSRNNREKRSSHNRSRSVSRSKYKHEAEDSSGKRNTHKKINPRKCSRSRSSSRSKRKLCAENQKSPKNHSNLKENRSHSKSSSQSTRKTNCGSERESSSCNKKKRKMANAPEVL